MQSFTLLKNTQFLQKPNIFAKSILYHQAALLVLFS